MIGVIWNWDKHHDRFENMIGIKNSTLKDSLKMINISGCKITKGDVSKLLINHGLTSVSVINKSNDPLIN